MAAVLDDLLNLSRVSRAEMNLQDVDLSAEVTAICGQLRAGDPSRRVQVTVEEGVRATADRPLIRTVLEQLLGNAWKFTAGREHATIEFATTPVGEPPSAAMCATTGPASTPPTRASCSSRFSGSTTPREFPGTGMGLALVQRIIDRHGGRTWVEGAVGDGATVYFTLHAASNSVNGVPGARTTDRSERKFHGRTGRGITGRPAETGAG